MDGCFYDQETKTVILKFDRTMIHVDLEDFMDVLYTLHEAKIAIQDDPEVELGSFTDEDGKTREQFVVKGEEEEYS